MSVSLDTLRDIFLSEFDKDEDPSSLKSQAFKEIALGTLHVTDLDDLKPYSIRCAATMLLNTYKTQLEDADSESELNKIISGIVQLFSRYTPRPSESDTSPRRKRVINDDDDDDEEPAHKKPATSTEEGVDVDDADDQPVVHSHVVESDKFVVNKGSGEAKKNVATAAVATFKDLQRDQKAAGIAQNYTFNSLAKLVARMPPSRREQGVNALKTIFLNIPNIDQHVQQLPSTPECDLNKVRDLTVHIQTHKMREGWWKVMKPKIEQWIHDLAKMLSKAVLGEDYLGCVFGSRVNYEGGTFIRVRFGVPIGVYDAVEKIVNHIFAAVYTSLMSLLNENSKLVRAGAANSPASEYMKGVLDSLGQTLFSPDQNGSLSAAQQMFFALYSDDDRANMVLELKRWSSKFGNGLRTQGIASSSGDYYAKGLQQGKALVVEIDA